MNPRPHPGSPATTYGVEIDPFAILNVSHDATLEEIREAYRDKAKKYHPDKGGDEWAFRIVARSYEILSTARVASRANLEARRTAPSATPASSHDPVADESGWLRPGRRDPWIDPARMVDIEVLVIRFEPADPRMVLLEPAGERNLSCCLNLSWIAPRAGQDREPLDITLVKSLLAETFDDVRSRTGAISSWSRVEDDRFEGWLSYPSASLAWEAFRQLHETLNGCGLGVNQWTRDLVIPRATP